MSFDHVSAHTFADFIDACETLRKELLKSMKIAKKFKEELKLVNLEKIKIHTKGLTSTHTRLPNATNQ